jgi:methylated-DNA-[protein]-cysteine S-methyltransferase
MKKAYFYDTKIGNVFIAEDGQGITDLTLTPNPDVMKAEGKSANTEFELVESELLKYTAQQLMEYLEGNRKEFDVILNPKGTNFQKEVWKALQSIPYGETRSYKDIAKVIGNEKASRAIGMANHHNPIMCIIPCHRVIGANGKMVGYVGGIQIKEQLLNLEKEGNRG